MIFSDRVYEFVKWLVMIAIPAFSAAYYGLAGAWDLPNADQVVATGAVIAACLGTLVGISTNRYKATGAAYDGTINLEMDPGGMKTVNMVVDGDPETALASKDMITFKVVRNDE